jgi:hypothetical protein
MFKKFLIAFLLFSHSAFASEIWNSKEGLNQLARSQFKNDFYQLVNFYQPQINKVYCSAASSVVVLNALNSENLYQQESFFNVETDKIKLKSVINRTAKNSAGIYDAGLSLGNLNRILSESYNLKTELFYATTHDQESINNFRKIIKSILSENKKFLIANFNGKILGQKTGGHVSPIAAYDEISDSILILDVALHKNQWFWADLNKFHKAMNSKDGKNPRGFLIVQK